MTMNSDVPRFGCIGLSAYRRRSYAVTGFSHAAPCNGGTIKSANTSVRTEVTFCRAQLFTNCCCVRQRTILWQLKA